MAMPLHACVQGWHRPSPTVAPTSTADWQWPPAGPAAGLVLETSIASSSSNPMVLSHLLHQALSGPLLPSQQQVVIGCLEADPEMLHVLQLEPQQLPLLVEHTPILAHWILLRMLSSRQALQLHQVVAHMPLSLHSMEVVNKLTASGCLPAEVVHTYISNCMNACEDMTDTFMQSRLVRLVCVFLQSLIRHRVLDTAGLLLEVQAFCVRFSRIREAATLFRVLKHMEQGGCTSGSPVLEGNRARTAGSRGAQGAEAGSTAYL